MSRSASRRVVNPNKVFQQTGGLNVGRSRFDLSHQVILSADMGQLIPIVTKQMIPGDIWHDSVNCLVRLNPTVAPIMHEINAYFFKVFVPHRLVDDRWEDFITGGQDGDITQVPIRWVPTHSDKTLPGTLWDHMGFPIGVVPTGDYAPLDHPKRAYNLFVNEFIRDQNLDPEIDIETNEDIYFMRWEKDYFASALPFQTRGTPPAIPITGTTSAVWTLDVAAGGSQGATQALQVVSGSTDKNFFTDGTGSYTMNTRENIVGALNTNTVSLEDAGLNITINDIRTTAVLQQWMELNARAGARYTEYLQSVFDEKPEDYRLQRPEYIGRVKVPIMVSEVQQTSAVPSQPTPQGNLAGRGAGTGHSSFPSYKAREHGTLMVLMCIRPRAVYSQGFPREWMPQTVFDLYTPQFANLQEQAILNGEVYATGTDSEDTDIWGYQGRYSEYRYSKSRIAGLMHNDLDHWHLARKFDSLPALNSTFLSQQDARKDFLAVPSEPAFVVTVGCNIYADRPIPAIPVPGITRI